MELILSQDLAKAIPQEIGFNHEELKAQLKESLSRYNDLTVTEDAIQPAKKDRAALNALKTAIDNKRKDVKKACLAPYESFESKAKEILSMIQSPIDAIDRQIKGFEDAERQKKYSLVEHYYKANIKELMGLVPLERIIPEKWANKGMSVSDITESIIGSITKIRNDMEIIRAMRLSFETQVIDAYIRTLDMSAALAEKTRLEEQERKIALARKQREAERAADHDAEPVIVTGCGKEITGKPAQMIADHMNQVFSESQEVTKTIEVRFYDTTVDFRREMKALTEKHGIKYGGIA